MHSGVRIPYGSPYYYRGVEQLAARRAHNPKVAGSSPAPATIKHFQLRRVHFYSLEVFFCFKIKKPHQIVDEIFLCRIVIRFY